MKKSYKLIKTYPGSPKLGTIIIEAADIKGKYFIKRSDIWFINNPENYPEFWETIIEYPIDTKVFNEQTKSTYIKKEDGWYKTSNKTAYTDEMITKYKYINIIEDKVVEKDYEILSLTSIESPTRKEKVIWYFDKENNGWTVDEPERAYYKDIPNFTSIYSVKRLSDGEIFTIGDKISSKAWKHLNSNDFIKKIFIATKDTEEDFSSLKEGNIILMTSITWQTTLNDALKIKQPLFKTEDGVDIFEGDRIYIVDKFTFSIDWVIIDKNGNLNRSFIFSKREKAEEYILMNKPCLSLNDLKPWGDLLVNNLIELVKQKLK